MDKPNPRTLAKSLKVSDKRVRSIARERIARFQDGRYTVHEYSPAEVALIAKAVKAGQARSSAQQDKAPKAPRKSSKTARQTAKAAIVESLEA